MSGLIITCGRWTNAVGLSIMVVIAVEGDAPILLEVVDADLKKKSAA